MKQTVIILCCLLLLDKGYTQIMVNNLRCEMLVNPLAVPDAKPRLSWEITGKERGIRQEAYEILVSSNAAKLAANQADLWSTGKVNSEASLYIRYDGAFFRS